ncbi:MAG TPA: hypothetical protein VGP89_18090 [Candidatus Angelobacter sp.]|nr:hypothetical protein [Candidatus Angelobacter sp.]
MSTVQIIDPLTNHPWWPKTPAQQAALDCEAELLMFGGAAGSLKSHTLCLDAIQERDNPNLRAIFFRQTFPQLSDLLEKQQRLYRPMLATYNEQKKVWTFPSKGTVSLGYLDKDTDVWNYWGKEFSAEYFDESTLLPEFRVRTLLSRLRTTDTSLRPRARLGTNPGGIGAAWHIHTFLRGHCPVHEPTRSAIPGTIYKNATWKSDNAHIPLTTAFIPGKLSDHNLLGDRYAQLLRMQSGSLAKSLEMGCWCELDGAYFSNWNKDTMRVPYATVGERWWDSHFISMDYGFGKSSASAHLHVRTQDGKIRTIGEFVVAHMPAYEFANEVIERLVKPVYQGNARRIVAVYLDPANFKDIGDGHTIADQINEKLDPYNLVCTKASNDRIGGWQLMYQMLSSGEWAVADTCPKLVEAIPTRMHDEKKPGDLIKVPGDDLDDVMDDTRYGIYSFITTAVKPDSVRIEEALAGIPIEDATSRMIRHAQITAELAVSKAPVALGRRGLMNARRNR